MKKITSVSGSGDTPVEVASSRTVKHGVSRLLPYAPPWLIWLASLGVAVTVWSLWGANPDARPWIALGTFVAGEFWVGITYRVSRAHHEVVRFLACASIALVSAFIVISSIVGPFTRPLIDLWGGVGFSVCVGWGIQRILSAQTRGGENGVATAGQKIADALGRAKMGNARELEGGRVEIPYELDRGAQTHADMKAAGEAISVITGQRPGAVRKIEDTDDSGMGTLVFNTRDLLKGIIPWPGPLFMGDSVARGVNVGLYETQDLAHLYLTADKKLSRAAAQWLIMGMNGAGKSAFALMMMADLLTRRDVTVWAHDHVKGLQTLKPILEGGGIDYMSMQPKTGKQMLAEARRVIQARARWMGANDLTDWEEGCGLNLLVVWIEEATELASMGDLIKIVREGRSVGVILIVSLQRASHVSMSTEARAQLSGNVCFGVDSSQDAAFCLPDHVRDAGAEPEKWKNSKQGYCYISAPGIDETLEATPLRTYMAEREQIVAAVKAGKAYRTPLDDVSQGACSPIYHQRIDAAAYLPGHPDFERVVMGVEKSTAASEPATEEESETVNDEGEGGNVDDDGDDFEAETAEAVKNFASPVTVGKCPTPDLTFAPAVSRSEKREISEKRVQDFLAKRLAEGESQITAKDLSEMTPPVLYGRETLRQHLKYLSGPDADVKLYRLSRDENDAAGTYSIIAPQ